jgi:DNA-directed RNA polymerase specialized sigma24 family protein
VTDTTSLSHEELMALWEQGQRMASARCSGTLRSLRCGKGGFYDADDLWQDLFLDFWALVRRWHDAPPPRRAEDLWAAWRRCLWQGGRRVLRRPQRLWQGREQAVDPHELELDDDPSEEGDTRPAITPGAREALIEPLDLEEAWSTRSAAEAAERGLWGLSATNRQALYLTSIVGLSHAEAARCLGLASETSLHSRVHRARMALRGPAPAEDDLPQGDATV